jgi:uncharacterized protein RhaS with RHS repeats
VRYTQSDPLGIRGGPNPYLYARANPLFFIDPLGLVEVACPCEYEDPVKQAHGDVVAANRYQVHNCTIEAYGPFD